MTPHQVEQFVSQRTSELRMQAHEGRPHVTRGQHTSVRRRAGWALVEIGLRLAASPGSG